MPATLSPSQESDRQRILKEGTQRYLFLADAIPLIIWTARPDGGIDYYNKAWVDYTGLNLAQQCVEPRLDRVALGRGNQLDVRQHGGMRPAALNVERGQPPVERHGFAESQHQRGRFRRETSAPRGLRMLGHTRAHHSTGCDRGNSKDGLPASSLSGVGPPGCLKRPLRGRADQQTAPPPNPRRSLRKT